MTQWAIIIYKDVLKPTSLEWAIYIVMQEGIIVPRVLSTIDGEQHMAIVYAKKKIQCLVCPHRWCRQHDYLLQ
jgi:hypothetical protein